MKAPRSLLVVPQLSRQNTPVPASRPPAAGAPSTATPATRPRKVRHERPPHRLARHPPAAPVRHRQLHGRPRPRAGPGEAGGRGPGRRHERRASLPLPGAREADDRPGRPRRVRGGRGRPQRARHRRAVRAARVRHLRRPRRELPAHHAPARARAGRDDAAHGAGAVHARAVRRDRGARLPLGEGPRHERARRALPRRAGRAAAEGRLRPPRHPRPACRPRRREGAPGTVRAVVAPHLRAPVAQQGHRDRPPGAAGRDARRPGRDLPRARRHPPARPCPARGGLPRAADAAGRRPRRGGPRPVRRPVRGARRHRPRPRRRGRLPLPLPEPRADHVGHARLRLRQRQGGGQHAVLARRGAARRGTRCPGPVPRPRRARRGLA